MKMQSAIEFLSTYGFVFIVIAVVIAVIFFLATSAQTNFSVQCSGFGGFTCNYASYYTNRTYAYTVATISLSNSQSVPLNISNVSMTIGSTTVNGLCSPTFIYPGEVGICAAVFNSISSPGALVRGYYSVGAKYCNGGISSLRQGNCTQPVLYTGAFLAQTTSLRSVVFGAEVALGSGGAGLPSYASLEPMHIPTNFVIAQDGDWNTNGTSGNIIYSFGTSGYIGAGYLGTNAVAFPQSTSMLNNVSACSASASPMISMAYTTVYLHGTKNSESIETSNAMALYYDTGSTPWTAILGSASWSSHGLAQYASSTAFGNGLYGIYVEWFSPCGQGLQALNIS